MQVKYDGPSAMFSTRELLELFVYAHVAHREGLQELAKDAIPERIDSLESHTIALIQAIMLKTDEKIKDLNDLLNVEYSKSDE